MLFNTSILNVLKNNSCIASEAMDSAFVAAFVVFGGWRYRPTARAVVHRRLRDVAMVFGANFAKTLKCPCRTAWSKGANPSLFSRPKSLLANKKYFAIRFLKG